MKKIFPFLFFVVLFCFISCASFDSASNNEVMDMHDAKVWVSVTSKDELNLEDFIILGIQSKSLASDSLQNYNLDSQINETYTGSAFAISDNLLMTSNHIIENCSEVAVRINNVLIDASVVYADSENDLAILRVQEQLPYHFEIANSYKKGDAIMAIGYPLSDELGNERVKFSDGIIASETGLSNNPFYLQITAPIQPGNSGGPVVNNNFEVVGIVSSKLDELYLLESVGTLPQNINFALKPEILKLATETFVEKANSEPVKNSNEAEDATYYIEAYEKDNKRDYKYNFKLEVEYNEVWDPELGFTIYSCVYKLTNIETGIVIQESSDTFNNGYYMYSFNSFASTVVQAILNDMYNCEVNFIEYSNKMVGTSSKNI